MRLIMAKMIWSFDFELQPESDNWMEECRVMAVWIRPKLWMKVTEGHEG